ncbi:MAG: hypothetical protein OHK0039_35790 [Bacteroidia bacterium]
MHTLKEGVLLLLAPLGLGLVLWGLSASPWRSAAPKLPAYQLFEYTQWADTSYDRRIQYRLIQPSEREQARASIVLLKNDQQLLPFGDLDQQHIHLLTIGRPTPDLIRSIRYYVPASEQVIASVKQQAPLPANTTMLVVALHQAGEDPYVIRQYLTELADRYPMVLVNFDAYKRLKPMTGFATLVQAPDGRGITQDVVGQMLFGGLPMRAGLPTAWAHELALRNSARTRASRLAYCEPEYMGLSSDTLAQIEQIVQEGISQFAMPGCQVLVAYKGAVVYNRAFGHHTYDQSRPVRTSDLYDLASITKVAATTLAAMKLYEAGRIGLDDRLGDYFRDATYTQRRRRRVVAGSLTGVLPGADSLPMLPLQADTAVLLPQPPAARRQSRVFDIPIRDLLTHTSGLQAGLPIESYQRYLGSSLFSQRYGQDYTVPVAERFYLRKNYLDSIWNDTKGLRRDTTGYRYSCVNMILLQRVIDSLNQQSISDYLSQVFYGPLGLQTLCYNPRELFDPERLVPTASDRWRGQLLCGTVHDPTAALLGGISGNAGLFSNANDLAILGQLWLNGGTYGGRRYLDAATVALFTSRQHGHRGLGFDMPPTNAPYIVAPSAPAETYGHTGFTGTCIWVDPVHDLVFVFLSNRIHPSVLNYRLNELEIRQRVHQVVYRALGVPPRFTPPMLPEPVPADSTVFALQLAP